MTRKHKKVVTRKDVALRANVSTAVVSYVLNKGPRAVAPATRDKVERAIADLGYFPNEVARSLRSRRTSTIGLIVPDITQAANAEIASAVHAILQEHNHLLILCDSEGDPETEQELIESLRNKRVDGVVIVPSRASPATLRPLLFAGIPAVVLHQRIPNMHSITVDLIGAGRLATEHLVELGHERIAFLDGGGLDPSGEGEAVLGYSQSLAHAGIAFDESCVIEAAPSATDAERIARDLLAAGHRPTAIIAAGDTGVGGVILAARALELDIPGHLSLVGLGTTAMAAYAGPGVTSVEVSRGNMAEIATHIVLDAVAETNRASASELIVEVELVTRRSTGRLSSPRRARAPR